MDNNTADVTLSGRSFCVRGPTAGKGRLVGDGCQLSRWHCQTVGASRTERLPARRDGDIVEWTKVFADYLWSMFILRTVTCYHQLAKNLCLNI